MHCPNDAVREEVVANPLSSVALKRILKWTEKIQGMEDVRFPKICFKQIMKLSQIHHSKEKLN